MTDTVDQPVENTEEVESPDLNEDVVDKLSKVFDTRFSGFQGILDKNIANLRNEFTTQLNEVRRSTMTPEELEDLRESEKEAELRQLKKENQLLRLRKDYPDEVDFLAKFLEAESFEEQLNLVSSLKSNREAGPTPREEPDADEGAPIPVDKNNPKRRVSDDSLASLLRNSGSMTREQATKLLEATNERGIIARLRRES